MSAAGRIQVLRPHRFRKNLNNSLCADKHTLVQKAARQGKNKFVDFFLDKILIYVNNWYRM